jgi:hypothetical protein
MDPHGPQESNFLSPKCASQDFERFVSYPEVDVRNPDRSLWKASLNGLVPS